MKKFFFCLAIILSFLVTQAQKYQPNWESLNSRKIPAWFNKDKFGIFIHWGIYAVLAYAPVIPNSDLSYAEWYWKRIQDKRPQFLSFHEKNYGKDFSYENFEKNFKAELFNPDQWADIFKQSGARYVVLTSKHHEGYCLWNSAEADRSWGRPWNAVAGTPKRDLLGDLTNSVRKAGLKMGFYYSLYEWFNPLWLQDKKRFVDEHLFPQFKDLVNRYKPSTIFSDGEWELSDTAWKSPELLAWLFNESPVANEVVVNDRWGKNTRNKNHGATYATSEYGSGMDASVIWEENQGIGHSYGYNRNEQLSDYKTSRKLILTLIDIVARGGNLLLDVGPTADGRIPVIMQQRLFDMGIWLKTNGEAIYETTAWKQPYQWSAGAMLKKEGKNFMAGYDIAELIKTKKDTAYIQFFFTQKGRNLYCFIPSYTTSVSIKNFKASAGTRISVLGSNKIVRGKQTGSDYFIDLNSLKPTDLANEIFVVKLENAL
jgi:alpha-L-fucosidase